MERVGLRGATAGKEFAELLKVLDIIRNWDERTIGPGDKEKVFFLFTAIARVIEKAYEKGKQDAKEI